MINYADQSLSVIVTNQHSAALVFEKYELDFCCKGRQSLRTACETKNIPLDTVLKELEQLGENGNSLHENIFKTMSAPQLIDYIVLKHHLYVRQAVPLIFSHLEKVATKHGEHFPYMKTVYRYFASVAEEMLSHIDKEEKLLFPAIKQGGDVQNLINEMEAEHEQTGNWISEIRQLTDNYTAPVNACTTFRVSLAELKEFEEDLHRHVHLENYILFPKAQANNC